ncbi:hypothetical protein QUA82_13870 [Microcoleus sp. F8-D3]
MIPDPNFRVPIAISLGAVASALSRYYITLWFANRFGTAFPYRIFFINTADSTFMKDTRLSISRRRDAAKAFVPTS